MPCGGRRYRDDDEAAVGAGTLRGRRHIGPRRHGQSSRRTARSAPRLAGLPAPRRCNASALSSGHVGLGYLRTVAWRWPSSRVARDAGPRTPGATASARRHRLDSRRTGPSPGGIGARQRRPGPRHRRGALGTGGLGAGGPQLVRVSSRPPRPHRDGGVVDERILPHPGWRQALGVQELPFLLGILLGAGDGAVDGGVVVRSRPDFFIASYINSASVLSASSTLEGLVSDKATPSRTRRDCRARPTP